MKLKLSIAVSILSLLTSCSSATEAVKDKGTIIANTFIDCGKADIGRTVTEVGLTILSVATQILMAGEGNYLTKLDEIGAKYGYDAEACAVKAVNTVLTSGDVSHSMSPAAVRSASVIKSKGWKFKAD